MTIGNFDGVHRGHLTLVAECRRQGEAVGGPAVVLTFDPHPQQMLQPETFLPMLTTTAERVRLLQAAGADQVVILHTTPDLLELTPEEFFEVVVRRHFDVRFLVEGDNFGFGRRRSGSVETLAGLCRRYGLGLEIVPPQLVGGTRVCSSRVRSSLQEGAVWETAECLGRPYRLSGWVAVGQGRGRTLGFATANLEKITTVIPAGGVYAVLVLHEGQTWPGACNIGPNPTFGEKAQKVEVHLIGFEGDLYGQQLTLSFFERLRDTQPFASVNDLVSQLRDDVEQARQVVKESIICP
jgi:riboflavin kinase/FMN adenylyltransferase